MGSDQSGGYKNESTFNIVLGTVPGSFPTMVAFWRGSSMGPVASRKPSTR